MENAYVPYGAYWSTPFAKWQGPLAHLHSLKLAANTAKQVLADKGMPIEKIDLGVLGITNPQPSSFYGLPWVTGMIGLEGVAGPTVQQACATGTRCLQMANLEIATGTASCVLVVTADRMSNGPIVYYPDGTAVGGRGITESWTLDNFANDPFAGVAMVDTAERVSSLLGFSTEQQHDLVLCRYEQYKDALTDGRAFQRKYMVDVPLTDAGFRKQSGKLSGDDGIFPCTREGLAKLKPVQQGGTVTYGSQTHPADGNAGMIVTGRGLAREFSRDPSIEIELLGFGSARVKKGHMPLALAPAACKALQSARVDLKNIDAVKSHNPFAVNDLAFAKETGFPLEKMNNYGCSLVWGHPQGPTATRSVIELIEELVLRGGGTGIFTGCAAGDSGMAVVVRVREC